MKLGARSVPYDIFHHQLVPDETPLQNSYERFETNHQWTNQNMYSALLGGQLQTQVVVLGLAFILFLQSLNFLINYSKAGLDSMFSLSIYFAQLLKQLTTLLVRVRISRIELVVDVVIDFSCFFQPFYPSLIDQINLPARLYLPLKKEKSEQNDALNSG